MPQVKGTDGIRPPKYDSLTRKQIAQNLRKNLPRQVRQLSSFIVFKFAPPKKPGGKRLKLPYYVVSRKIRTGEQGSKEDKSHLVTFPEAVRLLEADAKWAGVGVCAVKDNPVFFIDVDNCIDLATGEISDIASELLGWRTYTELSPSGKGLRLVMSGNPQLNTKNHKSGIELFSTKGFVTLTGIPFGNASKPLPVRELTSVREQRLYELLETTPTAEDEELTSIPSPLTKEKLRDVNKALKHIDPDCGYHDWLLVGQALHSGDHTPDGKGFQTWLKWSQKGSKFQETSAEELAAKWRGFHAGRGKTLNSLFRLAQQEGWDASNTKEPTEPVPDDTHVEDGEPIPANLVKTIKEHPLAEKLFDHYGAYLFIGRAKIGKSRILGAFVAAALSGGNALDFMFQKKCKVLALTLEEHSSKLLTRIRDYAVEPTEYADKLLLMDDRVVAKAAQKLSEKHTWSGWVNYLLKKYRPDFMYIDPTVKLKMIWQNDPEYKSKNVTEQDYQNVQVLDEAARRYKCYIISVVHGSKRKNMGHGHWEPFESIGTTSWSLGACAGALALMDKPGFNVLDDKDDGQRVFSVRGRYIKGDDGHYLVQNNSNGTLTNMGPWQQVQATVKQQEYLNTLYTIQRESGLEWVTSNIIAAEHGVHNRTVKVLLKSFADTKQLWEGMQLVSSPHKGYKFISPEKPKNYEDILN